VIFLINLINDQITKNFKLREIACKNNGELYLTPEVVAHAQRLQRFRDWYNRPICVTSWYRTKEYNAKVGGVSGSFHLRGIASDIALPAEFSEFDAARREEFFGNIKRKWAELCEADGLGGGVGWYDSFFHLDSRPGESLAFWDYRGR
jgi:hypothetical protein